jgi:hypothetical protein
LGANGELDMAYWLYNETTVCSRFLAVPCVLVQP